MTKERLESELLQEVLAEIIAERKRQAAKWGKQEHCNEVWLTIAQEELGEVARAILECTNNAHEELIQTAAVLVAWAEDQTERGQHPPQVTWAARRST